MNIRGGMGDERTTPARTALIITADDYGYWPSYDRGILGAAAAGAVDAVSAMVTRPRLDPAPLLDTGAEIGLHLELPRDLVARRRAGDAERRRALRALTRQLESFEAAFGRPPAYLDGHRHCHAHPGLGEPVAEASAARGLMVRPVSEGHRQLLRAHGVLTVDRVVGRLSEDEEALPRELEDAIHGRGLPGGVTEWMVHPGYPDPAFGSAFDAGREEDLDLLLRLRLCPALSAARLTHAAALR
jgi:predicted glycoside hydrolase/deacetylase ChbG (UPF0249 family)